MGSADFAQPVRGVAQRLQRDTLPCIPEERSARGIRSPWLNLRKRVYIGSREGGEPVPALLAMLQNGCSGNQKDPVPETPAVERHSQS